VFQWESNGYYIFLRVRASVRARICVLLGTRAQAYACASIALLIQHATRRNIAICGLSGSTIFFDIISQTAQSSEKVVKNKMCFDFLYNLGLKHFSLREEFSAILS
jgi:hypothetical protein